VVFCCVFSAGELEYHPPRDCTPFCLYFFNLNINKRYFSLKVSKRRALTRNRVVERDVLPCHPKRNSPFFVHKPPPRTDDVDLLFLPLLFDLIRESGCRRLPSSCPPPPPHSESPPLHRKNIMDSQYCDFSHMRHPCPPPRNPLTRMQSEIVFFGTSPHPGGVFYPAMPLQDCPT